MKTNDVFTFTTPNGVEVTAVCLNVTHCHQCDKNTWYYEYLCYAQNRLFIKATHIVYEDDEYREHDTGRERVVVDYAILPDYDELLGYTLPDKPDWVDAEEEAAKHGYGADEDV